MNASFLIFIVYKYYSNILINVIAYWYACSGFHEYVHFIISTHINHNLLHEDIPYASQQPKYIEILMSDILTIGI